MSFSLDPTPSLFSLPPFTETKDRVFFICRFLGFKPSRYFSNLTPFPNRSIPKISPDPEFLNSAMPAAESSSRGWTWEQDKQFEKAIVAYRNECPDRWQKVASEVAGKSAEDVERHYRLLLDDVNRIESGFVELPCYTSRAAGESNSNKSGDGGRESNPERRKGIAWTEDEHRLFLLGLEKYGKGDWRSISRNFVVTRTPTQVASHAQKYFIRLNSMNKDRRRSSIHDITNANTAEVPVAVPQLPASGGKTKSSNKPLICTMGQPIARPLVSAVGMPVNMPGHMAYGLVPGAPLTYSGPHAPPHR